MDIKQKITELTKAYPELLGFRGKLTYMLCEAIPENAEKPKDQRIKSGKYIKPKENAF